MLQHIFFSFLKPLLFTLPVWAVYRMYRIKKKREAGECINRKRETVLFLFYLYLLLVGTLTLLPQMDLSRAIPSSSQINIIPFQKNYNKLLEALTCPVPMCVYNWTANIVVNLLLFLPLGLLLPLVSKKVSTFGAVALVALCMSAGIELFQYFLTYWNIFRFSDVDDVILNVAGALAGFGLYKVIFGKRSAK